jgi:hypothetical protein
MKCWAHPEVAIGFGTAAWVPLLITGRPPVHLVPAGSHSRETSQTKELDFGRLNEAERAIFEQLCAQARPFLERLTDDSEPDGGTVN